MLDNREDYADERRVEMTGARNQLRLRARAIYAD